MPIFSNVDDVEKFVLKCLDDFGFDVPGKGNATLGDDCAEELAIAIRNRSLTEQRGGVGPVWPENKADYRKWKEKTYGETRTNIRSDHMLSVDSLKGVPVITKDEVVMNYGLGVPPPASGSPKEYFGTDDVKTDIQRAEYAQVYQSQGDRSFYNLSGDVNEPVLHRVAEALKQYIQDKADLP